MYLVYQLARQNLNECKVLSFILKAYMLHWHLMPWLYKNRYTKLQVCIVTSLGLNPNKLTLLEIFPILTTGGSKFKNKKKTHDILQKS